MKKEVVRSLLEAKKLLDINTISDPKQTPRVVNKKIDQMTKAQAQLDKRITELTDLINKKYDVSGTNVERLIGDLLA